MGAKPADVGTGLGAGGSALVSAAEAYVGRTAGLLFGRSPAPASLVAAGFAGRLDALLSVN